MAMTQQGTPKPTITTNLAFKRTRPLMCNFNYKITFELMIRISFISIQMHMETMDIMVTQQPVQWTKAPSDGKPTDTYS
ncbi:uncharacterized protein G2W53_040926 [Senna tora]|uniref:Uncharacterized protein n=1 Tax=Senna tora TaxID=362788 RepID=A0A834VYU5_9FABA|nr:uncharacterized protein G2W53_040926 [Senna tora]